MKTWMKWLLLALLLAVLGLGGARLMANRQAQKAAIDAQQAAQKTQAVVELGAADMHRVAEQTLTRAIGLSGTLKAASSALVKARLAGELQGLSLREGDSVRAGQVVARIDPAEAQARLRQAQQQAEAARAQVDIAQRSADNNRALVNQGFISRTALDTSLATLDSAQANHRAALAAVDLALRALDDAVLRAPISGVVSQRLAQPGERVAVDGRILEIVDLGRLEVEASLSPADSVWVRVGQTARLGVEGASQPLTARVVRVNPSAVAGSRAVLAYLALPPAPGLRQGLFAQGTLEIGSSRALAVPLSAVRTDKPQPYLQLAQQGQVVHRTVTLGARGEQADGTWVAVQGVEAGAVVLAGSVGALRAGTMVKLPPGN
ncbi:MAG: efflux RND transporter periplasmic adaptor subunit [Rhodoferax sp.]|nr:efflux RND transporter periplasmic adaptor subunit [Rhodoferax sp.]